MLVSVVAVAVTLMVTVSVLFWNYSETRTRRLTKKQSVILDHWGKESPLLNQEDLKDLLHGGITYYGETALRSELSRKFLSQCCIVITRRNSIIIDNFLFFFSEKFLNFPH